MAGFEVITEVSTLRVCFLCKLLIRRSTLQVESVCNERTLSGKTIKTQSAERRDHRIPEVVFGCSQETKGYAQPALGKLRLRSRSRGKTDVLCAQSRGICLTITGSRSFGRAVWTPVFAAKNNMTPSRHFQPLVNCGS